MSTLLTLLTEEGAGCLCEEEAEVAGRAQEVEATTSATTPLVSSLAIVGFIKGTSAYIYPLAVFISLGMLYLMNMPFLFLNFLRMHIVLPPLMLLHYSFQVLLL
jgi:hypothetical protein